MIRFRNGRKKEGKKGGKSTQQRCGMVVKDYTKSPPHHNRYTLVMRVSRVKMQNERKRKS
jgi:hypothetical protein